MTQKTNDSVAAVPPPTTLFYYTVVPEEVTTSTGTNNPVTFTIGIYNPTANGAVTVSYIEFAISIGTDANDLTDDWQDVKANSNQAGWHFEVLPYTSSPLICKVTPASASPPQNELLPNQSLSFELTGVNINDTEGPAPVRISEVTTNHAGQNQTGQDTRIVSKASPSLQASLQVTPTTIQVGEPATLSWTTSGASSCTIDQLDTSTCSPPDPPPNPLPLNGELQVCPQETTTYTLTAFDQGGGYRMAQAAVTVEAVHISSFKANPDTIDNMTPTSTLNWDVQFATKLTLDPGGLNVTGQTSQPVTPTITSRDTTSLPYTLTAEGAGDSVSAGTTVYVNQAAITSFTATPVDFVHGEPVTLQWATEYANSCSIDQGVGAATPTSGGSLQVSPQETTTYTLSAEGLGVADTSTATATLLPTGWQQQTTFPPGGAAIALNFQDKIWLITGANLPPSVSNSSDGFNWTQVTTTLPFTDRAYYAGAVFDDGSGEKMWLMGGTYSSGNPISWYFLNDIWSSPDGIHWTQAQTTSTIWSGRFGHACVVFQGKMWVLGGFDTLDSPASDNVWSSTDCIHWTKETNAPWGARAFFGATVFNPSQPANINQLWLCGGAPGTDSMLNDAWYTNDCVTWTKASSPPWSARVCWNLLPQFNDKLWLVGGFPYINSAKFLSDMWTMDASMKWTSVGTVSGSYYTLPPLPLTFVLNWRIWLAGPSQEGGSQYQCYNP